MADPAISRALKQQAGEIEAAFAALGKRLSIKISDAAYKPAA